MLWTVFVILLILWLLGLMTSHTMGGFIHILLVIAIVVVLVRIIQGKNQSNDLDSRWTKRGIYRKE
jgi:uncharacterized membrane protein